MMNEMDVCSAVDSLVANCVIKQDKFLSSQREKLDQFYGRPYGDEEDGRSSVVTTEISDLVNADMPSLARVFLGSGDVVEFIPNTEDPADIQEARDKQAYVSWVIDTADNSYRELTSFLKSIEIYDVAAIEYGMESKEVTQVKRYFGLDPDEIAVLLASFEEEDGVERVTVTEGERVEFTLTRIENKPFVRNVPIDVLLISGNSASKNDAPCIGKEWQKKRGDLVAEGYSKEQVSKLTRSDGKRSCIEDARFFDQGGTEDQKMIQQWSNELVSGVDVYVLLDEDEDGTLERRHIIKSGDAILEDEIIDHVPYAIGSAELMPDNLVGRGRAALVQSHQRVNTYLTRAMIDNMARHNNPRIGVRKDPNGVSGVNMDDLLDDRLGGAVRTDGRPSEDLYPIVIPYIGDSIMQVQAGQNQRMAQTTGTQLANQALSADNLHKETATRFEGVQEAGLAKIELVSRNVAETAWTDLYEGLAWLVSRFQDSEREFYVLGKQLTVNPADWRFDHKIRAVVGTGSGDDSKTVQNLMGILQLQREAVGEGTTLSDVEKIYNTLAKITKALGQHTPAEYFNDPAEPTEVQRAELDILRTQVAQLAEQLQQSNPLAEVEQIKVQGKLMEQQGKMQMEAEKLQQQAVKDLMAMQQETREQMANLKLEYDRLRRDYTELELKYSTDVPGEGQGE